MMNELAPVIEKIAESLGTTAGELWAVLLVQAPISAVTDIIQYAALIACIVFWPTYVKGKCADIKDGTIEDENMAWIVIGWVILTVFAIAMFFSFPMTIAKLLNPEYWAFMEILDKITPAK